MVSCCYEINMVKQTDPITCKYQLFYFNNRWVFLPLLKVIIESKEKIGTIALVDSGATNTFIPRQLAGVIELFSEKKNKMGKGETRGASGKFKTEILKLKKLELFKEGHIFDTFRSISVHVPANEEEDLPHVILGRDYLFKRYDVTFYEKRRKMTFQRTDKH